MNAIICQTNEALNANIPKDAWLLDFYKMTDIRKHVGSRIAEYRARAGFSPPGAAKELKIAASTVYRVEDGDSWPEYPYLKAYADLYRCAVEDFFVGVESGSMPASPEMALRNYRELLGIIATMDEPEMTDLLNHARRLQVAAAARATGEMPDDPIHNRDVGPRPKRKPV